MYWIYNGLIDILNEKVEFYSNPLIIFLKIFLFKDVFYLTFNCLSIFKKINLYQYKFVIINILKK